MASRLSQGGKASVVLLEAGPPDSSALIHTPMMIGTLVGHSKTLNWRYETEPEPQLDGRRLYWPRGKTLGGSSSINAMVYTRGQREDYDHWGHDLQLDGWSYEHVLPFFKRSQNQERLAPRSAADSQQEQQRRAIDARYHGTGGPLNVTDGRAVSPLSHKFVDAAQELGCPTTDDFNGASQGGFGLYQVTQIDGQRCSTSRAFLSSSVRQRPNLHIVTDALAHRVLFDKTRATGVEFSFSTGGSKQTQTVHANREVIVCGGAVNSPQLLQLSGIGDQQLLHRVGVPLVHHLPGIPLIRFDALNLIRFID